ncbi:hypothetical protein CVT24_003520 [Panaeolus cyanescens]|uniref:Uncharacterized protein n=1 Tax=Panaeolus cyanescens TaxID=181874 RepID=A0A409Y7D2_9AGAR|nr:hypothetical protein CVT24_003520 [Panaeolus cyanescens]
MDDIPPRDPQLIALPTSVVVERRAYPTTDFFIHDLHVSQASNVQLRTRSPIPYPEEDFLEPQLLLTSALSDADGPNNTLTIISSEESNQQPSRVHFRSRVRITSGINHHRHRLSTSGESEGLRSSRSSSLSGSSSISAPLRSHADEQVGKPGWGTLGQRVSLFAKGGGLSRRQRLRNRREQIRSGKRDSRCASPGSQFNAPVYDERSPLNRGRRTQLYVHANSSDQDIDDEEIDYHKEVEMVFGPWPSRLLNHHWWWWKMEPILCCRHSADSDEEG